MKDDIPFYILKSKYLNDYDVTCKHLNEEYGLLKMNYKLNHPNLLRNDEYIEHYQKNHWDFDIGKPKISKKLKSNFLNYEEENKRIV